MLAGSLDDMKSDVRIDGKAYEAYSDLISMMGRKSLFFKKKICCRLFIYNIFFLSIYFFSFGRSGRGREKRERGKRKRKFGEETIV